MGIMSMQLPLFRGGQLVAVVATSASHGRHGLFWLVRAVADVHPNEDRVACRYFELGQRK
jgi:hypothetical protein